MNFLAHTYLSQHDDLEMLGNFIGDSVKGNSYEQFSPLIKKGIILHRAIDTFTDNSEIVKESKKIFYPIYGRYAGIIVDVLYDHFLSIHWHTYSNVPREVFITRVHTVLKTYYKSLPYHSRRIIPSVIYNNWMRYYASFYGIEKVLTKMASRTTLPHSIKECVLVLKQDYSQLESHFKEFFYHIQQFVNQINNEQEK